MNRAGKRRRKPTCFGGAARSLKVPLPKLSPYIAQAMRRLPPVKVHVINPQLDLHPPSRPRRPQVANSVDPHSRVSTLTENTWKRTCSECGSGMNLRLQVSNPSCRCQQDSLVVSIKPDTAAVPGALPTSPSPLRPHSSHSFLSPRRQQSPPPRPSPRNSSSCAGNVYPVAPAAALPLHGVGSPPPLTTGEKILLRYSEPRLRAPLQTPQTTTTPASHSLPRLRRYAGAGGASKRRERRDIPPRLSLSMSAGTVSSFKHMGKSIFWDPRHVHSPLAIIPRGPSR
ncbi:hypothetical protein ACOMHN_013817 [Nucella lapillus]